MWKCLLKKESFELGFEVREGGEILQAGRQWIPDSWSNETERMVTNRIETECSDFQKFLVRWSEGAWSLICAERSWKVRGKWTIEVTVGKSCDLVFAADFTGSKWSSFSSGVIWSHFCFFRMSWEALFWTLCRTVQLGSFWRNESIMA